MADILTVTTGKVDCRLAVTTNDQTAPAPLFDTMAPTGYVYLRPRKTAFVASDPGVIVIPDEISLVVDAEGWAVMPDSEGGPSDVRTIDLPAAEGMTWQVSFDLRVPAYPWQTGVAENRLRVAPFDIPVEPGTTTHIADYLPTGVDPSAGTVWVKGDKGDAGPGIKDMVQVDGELLIELENGNTLGPFDLPASTVPGPRGEDGPEGKPGPPGAGIPGGGSAGQVPARTAAGASEWRDVSTLVPAATEQQAGLMTAADKAKLSGAATVQQIAVARDHARAKASCVFGEYLGNIYSLVKAGNGGPTPGMVEKRFGGTALPRTGTSCTPVMDTLDTYAARHIRPIAFNASGWKVSGNIGELRGAQILGGQVFHDFENFDTSPAGIEALGVRADGTVGLYSKLNGDSAASMVADGVDSSFSYGPILVRDGVKRVLSDARWLYFADTTLSARQIFGTDAAGNFMVCTVEGVSSVSGLTGPQAADLAVILGFRQAILMDGGGSAQAYANGVQAMPSTDAGGRRAVPDALFINAELLDPAVDTGWWDVQYKAGYQQNSQKLQVRQRAGITYLQGDVKPTSGNFGVAADAVVANIRSRFRHSGAAKPFLVLGNGENTRKVVANSAGDISVVAMAQSSTPPYLNLGNVSWL